MRLGSRPTLHAGRHVHTLDRQAPALDVDVDDVPVAQRRQRAAHRRLGRDVPDHQTARGARESPVGDHRHRFPKAFADDGGGHLQHLPHPRPAARALVADDDGVARLDLAARHSGERVLFAIEDSRGTAVGRRRVLRDLDHRALRRQRAAQHHQAAFIPQGLGQRRHDFLTPSLAHRLAFFAQRSARDRERVAVHETALDQSLRQHPDAAGAMQLDGRKPAARLEVAQQRRAPADAIDVVDVELHADLARHRQQVQHRIGRAAARRHRGDRIVERAAHEDARWPEVVFQNRRHQPAGHLGRTMLVRVHRGDGIEAERRKADDLHEHGHRVGRVLTATRAGSRTRDELELGQVRLAHLAARDGADRLVHLAHRDVFAPKTPGHDGTAIKKDARPVEPDEADGGSGDRLVARADGAHGVEHVAAADELDGVGDDLAADQRGLHAFAPHRDAVRDRDGVELHGVGARHADAGLDRDRQLAQPEVARHGLEPAVGDAHERLVEVFRLQTDRVEERSRRRAIPAFVQRAARQLARGHEGKFYPPRRKL